MRIFNTVNNIFLHTNKLKFLIMKHAHIFILKKVQDGITDTICLQAESYEIGKEFKDFKLPTWEIEYYFNLNETILINQIQN